MNWKTQTTMFGAAAVLAGCGGSNGSSSSSSVGTSVRYINSVVGSGAIDFRLDEASTSSTQSLPYGGSSPDFTALTAKVHDIDFLEHGQTEPLWSESDTVTANTDYVAIAVGEEVYGTEDLKRPQLIVAPVDRSVPNGSKARLVVVNALIEATGVPTPSIDFTNPGNNPQFGTGSNPIAPAAGATLLVDAGPQEFVARQTDTQGSYIDKNFSFGAGKVYLMLVTGTVGSGSGVDIKQVELQTR